MKNGLKNRVYIYISRPRGVTVSTLDSESSDRGSNPREASWGEAGGEEAGRGLGVDGGEEGEEDIHIYIYNMHIARI